MGQCACLSNSQTEPNKEFVDPDINPKNIFKSDSEQEKFKPKINAVKTSLNKIQKQDTAGRLNNFNNMLQGNNPNFPINTNEDKESKGSRGSKTSSKPKKRNITKIEEPPSKNVIQLKTEQSKTDEEKPNNELVKKNQIEFNQKEWKEKYLEKINHKTYINITLVGASRVGKSCFIIKYAENRMDKAYVPSITNEVKVLSKAFNTHKYKVTLTATSTGDYKLNQEALFMETDIFIIMFDVTSPSTFEAAKNIYYDEIKKFYVPLGFDKCNIALVANKLDLKKEVIPEAREFCEQEKILYFEISVQGTKNTNLLMINLIKNFDITAYPETADNLQE